jgi:hypothetical protein
MPLFYFNFRDEEGALSDETGAEYRNIEEAKTAAVKCLADLAGDQGAVPAVYSLTIEGRDGDRNTLFEVRLTVETSSLGQREQTNR